MELSLQLHHPGHLVLAMSRPAREGRSWPRQEASMQPEQGLEKNPILRCLLSQQTEGSQPAGSGRAGETLQSGISRQGHPLAKGRGQQERAEGLSCSQ